MKGPRPGLILGKALGEVLGGLRIEVGASEPTPLQLGVDESYHLELTLTDGTLTAPTEWGAIRGIETFTQLVQWDGARHQLCALPLSITDAPAPARPQMQRGRNARR